VSCSYVYDMPRLTDTRLPMDVRSDRDTVELGGCPTMTVEARVWSPPTPCGVGLPAAARSAANGGLR
jgi:hypothetical protein